MMTDSPIGFPPQPRQAVFASLLTDLRDSADAARKEAVTGRMADIASGRDGAIGEVLDLERRLADLDGYGTTIDLALGRAGASQQSLEQLSDLVSQLAEEGTLALETGTEAARATFSRQATQALKAAVGALNVSFAGRALFAGDDGASGAVIAAEGPGGLLETARAAVEAAPGAATAATDLDALFDSGFYYLGGTGDAPAAEIAPGERIDYQARADTPVIRDLLQHVATLAVAFDPETTPAMPPEDLVRLVEGGGGSSGVLNDLRNLVAPLNDLRAEIGSAEARMETTRARQAAERARLTEDYNALTGRDTLESAARMQAIDGQLETLFLTTARFSQLSLASFLR